jgi:glycosyltransferase involved in cell wall biosynthesis
MSHLITHPNEAERLGEQGRKASADFTWEASVRQLESILERT